MEKDDMEIVFNKYNRELYLYAFSLCKNHHLAQDLTSDTFYKAYLSMDDVKYFKFWLFRVCKNLYLDICKKNKVMDSKFKFDELSVETETPLDKIIINERKKQIFKVILELNDSYKEILILYYYSDFSIKEISLSKDISIGATKTMLSRARKKLKLKMEENHEL